MLCCFVRDQCHDVLSTPYPGSEYLDTPDSARRCLVSRRIDHSLYEECVFKCWGPGTSGLPSFCYESCCAVLNVSLLGAIRGERVNERYIYHSRVIHSMPLQRAIPIFNNKYLKHVLNSQERGHTDRLSSLHRWCQRFPELLPQSH